MGIICNCCMQKQDLKNKSPQQQKHAQGNWKKQTNRYININMNGPIKTKIQQTSNQQKIHPEKKHIIINSQKIKKKLIESSSSGIKDQVNIKNVDQKIMQASLIKDKQQAINLFNKISLFLIENNDNKFTNMQKLAYVQTSLAQLYFINNSIDCQQHENRALEIYKNYQSQFFQQIVFIVNNQALRHEKNGQFDKAIDKYQSIIQLQRKYYSINDQRRLLSMNNLACVYLKAQNYDKGTIIFRQLLQKVILKRQETEITSLIKKNYQFYFNKR